MLNKEDFISAKNFGHSIISQFDMTSSILSRSNYSGQVGFVTACIERGIDRPENIADLIRRIVGEKNGFPLQYILNQGLGHGKKRRVWSKSESGSFVLR